jgi:integral membrane protein (TIGR01906 family)
LLKRCSRNKMGIRTGKWLEAIAGLAVSVAIILTSVQLFSESGHFYEYEFSRLDVYANIGRAGSHLGLQDFNKLPDAISGYLSDKYPDFSVQVETDSSPLGGDGGDGFNDREKEHMKDVKALFRSAMSVRSVSALAASAIALYALARERAAIWSFIRRMMGWASVWTAICAALLVLVSTVDFTSWFMRFHEALFTNDMWLLDPSTSLLINVLPEQFFVDVVIFSMASSLGASLALLGAARMFSRLSSID